MVQAFRSGSPTSFAVVGGVRGHPVRLSDAQIEAIVVAHLGGTTVERLVDQFGVHRTTIATHLRRAGARKDRQLRS